MCLHHKCVRLSFGVENLGDVREAVEHVELFVSALNKVKVSGGNDFGDARLLQVLDVLGALHDVVVQKLVEQLLAVIAVVDDALCHTLDVSISGSSGANHGSCHQDSLVRYDARDAVYVGLAQPILLREASASLQCVDAATQVTLRHLDKLLDDAL